MRTTTVAVLHGEALRVFGLVKNSGRSYTGPQSDRNRGINLSFAKDRCHPRAVTVDGGKSRSTLSVADCPRPSSLRGFGNELHAAVEGVHEAVQAVAAPVYKLAGSSEIMFGHGFAYVVFPVGEKLG